MAPGCCLLSSVQRRSKLEGISLPFKLDPAAIIIPLRLPGGAEKWTSHVQDESELIARRELFDHLQLHAI